VKAKRRLISSLIKRSSRTKRYGNSRPSQLRSKVLQSLVGGLLALFLLLAALPAYTQSPSPSPAVPLPSSPTPSSAPSTAPPLRIATRFIRPDAFEENGKIVGFSADIGRSILEQLQRQAVIKTYPDVPEILNAIRLGQADLGGAAIAITSQRVRDFDFSLPILSGELQIMVPVQAQLGLWQSLSAAFLSSNVLEMLGLTALLMIIPAHLIWYFERREDGVIDHPPYIPGIFEAFWWTITTLVAQSEEMPKGILGRIVALFWIFIGIIFVAYFTAALTTALTLGELQGDIQELNDLQDRRVALIADGETVDYIKERNVQQVIEFTQPEQAYEALLTEKVDAIIAPRPLLLYYASREGRGKVKIVGMPFRDRFYSIVMPKNSLYRKPINQAILTLKENGTYRKIYQKWYGVNPAD
jgi:polar amino acid transport system substrate-binding protein